MNDVTFIVKTFLRPKSLDRLIRSIRRSFATAPILVADDGPIAPPLSLDGAIKVIRLPFDTGLAEGRNRLVAQVETPFLCNLDDDWELVPESNVECMSAVLRSKQFDLVAGRLKWAEPPYWIVRYEGMLHRNGSELVMDAAELRGGLVPVNGFNVEYRRAEIVHNFFLAKTQSIRRVGWDPQFKIGAEHADFFWRAKGILKIAFCPQSWVNHYRDEEGARYTEYRRRANDAQTRFLTKHGFTRIRRQPPEYWNYR